MPHFLHAMIYLIQGWKHSITRRPFSFISLLFRNLQGLFLTDCIKSKLPKTSIENPPSSNAMFFYFNAQYFHTSPSVLARHFYGIIRPLISRFFPIFYLSTCPSQSFLVIMPIISNIRHNIVL